jgi:glycosidase
VQPLAGDHFYVRLVAEKGDLAGVTCHYADKYERGAEAKTPLRREASDESRDYWTTVLPVPTNRLRYFFELRDQGGAVCFLSEHGLNRRPPDRRHYAGYFFYPYDTPIDRVTLPRWVPGTTFYSIFPDRFANGDTASDPPGSRPWGEKPTPRSFFGGDLAGIRQRLAWPRDLGIGCLYLTPVFAAPSNHKYDPSDYERVDPHFGSNDDLTELTREAHGAGMRVLLDGVFNHSGHEWFAFRDVRERGAASRYKDWFFKIESFPVDVDAVNYETFANRARNHPKLNTANPELREYLCGIGERWIREADIDGWRLDVANEVDHRFWRAFRDRVKAAKADAFIVGEVWHDAIRWLDGAQFDSVMHYPWRDAVLKYLERAVSPSAFAAWTTRIRHLYDPAVEAGLWYLLGTHDTARIRTELRGDRARARQAAVLLLTAPGAPLVYYGDEIGMEGEDDPDCRRCMEWDASKHDRTLLETYRTLILLRREKPWLAWGAFEDLVADDERELYVYRRRARGPLELVYGGSDELLYVALNTGAARAEVRVPIDAPALRDALSGARVPASRGEAAVTLDAGGAAVLVPDPLSRR